MGRLSDLFSPTTKKEEQQVKSISSYEHEYIMKEMFKQLLELANKNKTLSILEKIDAIILSKATTTEENAKKVTKLLVEGEAGFRMVGIYVLDDKKVLQRMELSCTDSIEFLQKQEIKKLIDHVVNHPAQNNILYAAIQDKGVKHTNNLYDGLADNTLISNRGAQEIQRVAELKTIYIYPLVIREEAIGLMIISLGETIDALKEYERDLMGRLTNVIAIAIDNALLFKRVQEANHTLKAMSS